MRFDTPWAFLLLLAIPAYLALRARRSHPAVGFSSTAHARLAGRSWRQRLLVLHPALRCATLALFTIALARPQFGREQVRDVSKGIAIEMVIDRSGSMAAEMEWEGRRVSRLDAAKHAFQRFVEGDGRKLKGRPNDLVGMVSFARYPDTVCPLTLAHGALSEFLEHVQIVRQRSEDGTAIGDALALAAARLQTAEETLARQMNKADRAQSYEIKNKVIILLTDGENNAGKRHPMQAARLAARWGIRIYTIGVGGGDAMTTIQTPFGAYKMPMGPGGLDESLLESIAKTTGGIYRRADDAESLQHVYEEIDRLETSDIESLRFLDYHELFAPFVLAGLALILLDAALAATILRRLP